MTVLWLFVSRQYGELLGTSRTEIGGSHEFRLVYSVPENILQFSR